MFQKLTTTKPRIKQFYTTAIVEVRDSGAAGMEEETLLGVNSEELHKRPFLKMGNQIKTAT